MVRLIEQMSIRCPALAVFAGWIDMLEDELYGPAITKLGFWRRFLESARKAIAGSPRFFFFQGSPTIGPLGLPNALCKTTIKSKQALHQHRLTAFARC